MGEDATRAEQSSSSLPAPTNSDSSTAPAVETQDLFKPSSSPSSPTQTLTRRSSKITTSPTGTGNQVSPITVVALLDQLVVMIESVQENQRRMEKRQVDLEGTVRAVQNDLTRLTKSHASTLGGVNKLLERSRKTSGYVKEVRERLERQSGQVKRLEVNHAHLLKRNHFKVLIFQEDNEIPTTLLTKDSTTEFASASVQDDTTVSPRASTIDANHSHEEGLQTISLSSDEDEEAVNPPLEGNVESAEVHEDDFPGVGSEHPEWSRADKFKRSSLKKVDSLKKAFSRSSIEKKINKIVPPARREKLMKSFTPNQPKSPSSKSSSFRVSPMTFNVKKVRDGDGEATHTTHIEGISATVEVPAMGGEDGQLPVAEVHNEEEKTNGKDSLSTPGSADGDVLVMEEGEINNGPSTKATTEETVQESQKADKENNENVNDNREDEEKENPIPAPASPLLATVAIQQAS